MFGEMFGELVRYRGLLGMLAWRDIRVRYKQSVLGIAWAFLMPLIQTLVLWAIFTFGPMRVDPEAIGHMPYLLFVLCGVIPWTLFSSTLATSVESLTRNSRLVTKIYFPREVFPLGTMAGALVDFAISQAIFIPIYCYYLAIDPFVHFNTWFLLIPLVLLIEVLLVAGLSLIVSMANLFFRDVKYLMTFVLQLWFFATNVMYPIRFQNHAALQWVATANPMIAILTAMRDCIMGHRLTDPWGLATSAAISVAVFLFGWRTFHQAEFKFAEYI